MFDNSCTFCNEFRGKKNCNFRTLFRKSELYTRVIIKTKNFVLMPGLGAIGDTYLLILPLNHYPNMATLPDKFYLEFESLKNAISEILNTLVSQPPIFFEHGVSINGALNAGCCVDHAHMHIFCNLPDIFDDLKRVAISNTLCNAQDNSAKILKDLKDLREFTMKGFGYLFYESNHAGKWGFPVNKQIESQLIRKLFVKKLGWSNASWDWRLFPRKEKVKKTWEKLHVLMKREAKETWPLLQ